MNLDDLLEEFKDDMNGNMSPSRHRNDDNNLRDSMWGSISFLKEADQRTTVMENNDILMNLRDSWDMNSLGLKLTNNGNHLHIPDYHNPFKQHGSSISPVPNIRQKELMIYGVNS
jgi:hypothetical protein